MTILKRYYLDTTGIGTPTLVGTADKILEIQYMYLTYTLTAAAGSRSIGIFIYDNNSNMLCALRSTPVQAFSWTSRDYMFARGAYKAAAFTQETGDDVMPMGLCLLEGYYIQIEDLSNRDPDNDYIKLTIQYAEHDLVNPDLTYLGSDNHE